MQTEENQRNKAAALAYWRAIDAATPQSLAAAAAAHLPAGHRWSGPAPFPVLEGPHALAAEFLAPLRLAIPDMRRETHIFFGGASGGRVDGTGDGRMWVCGSGYLTGNAWSPFIGIPCGERKLRLRWAEFLRFEDGEIAETQMLIDFIDWFEQLGLPVLPRSGGAPFVYPAPTAYDGVLEGAHDARESRATQELVRQLLFGGLNAFDKSDLASMGMARFFHENIKWYGPGGIGACLSLHEFEELHQRPWLVAFPDRRVQDLDSLFSEDRFAGSSGWAGVKATHAGPYLGHAATGRPIAVNGIDFWLRSGNRFTENWVFVDMIHLFAQMGIDLMARMEELAADAVRSSKGS
jgi:predicted ester cyclase